MPLSLGKDMEKHSVQRFEDAQRDIYEIALSELRSGRKRGHWMWFVFPQLRGLGQSHDSWFYGIAGLREAENYIQHASLGPRLIECTRAVLQYEHLAIKQIFQGPDDLKFGSCMTLFSLVADAPREFGDAIDRFFDGKPDMGTIELLRSK
jgi:uncharacterized protein (DUF1810 family)